MVLERFTTLSAVRAMSATRQPVLLARVFATCSPIPGPTPTTAHTPGGGSGPPSCRAGPPGPSPAQLGASRAEARNRGCAPLLLKPPPPPPPAPPPPPHCAPEQWISPGSFRHGLFSLAIRSTCIRRCRTAGPNTLLS